MARPKAPLLTDREAERLFVMVEQAKKRGVGIIYITHRMSEIRRIGDRITVLRDGKLVATLAVADADDERLLQLMTGRVISQVSTPGGSTYNQTKV